jgi:hypothetical protein
LAFGAQYLELEVPLEVRPERCLSSHPTTSTTILSSHKIPNAVSPYQTCTLLLTFIEVVKYMEFGPH